MLEATRGDEVIIIAGKRGGGNGAGGGGEERREGRSGKRDTENKTVKLGW